jgi:hypothetical protein
VASSSIGEKINAYKATTLEDLNVDGRIILKQILKKQDEHVCTRLIWLWDQWPVEGFCEHCNESPS